MRWWRKVFVVTPIVLGGVASWSILTEVDISWVVWLTAVLGLAAGMFPAVFKALELDGDIESVSRHAAAFKSLQDRFRQLSESASVIPDDEASSELDRLMERLESARAQSITAPERFFRRAQKKIAAGDYEFSVDMK